MNVDQIIKDIKNKQFKPVYLLHGDEDYYIDLISNYIENHALSDTEKGFNQTIFYGKDLEVSTLLNTAKRYPMMSNYQVVIVREAQDLKLEKAAEVFQAYCENPLKSTLLVLCHKHGKFDKRKKVYKIIEKMGLVFESTLLYENKIPAWIEDYTKSKNYHINPKAAVLLASYLGNDLSKITNELEKLMLNIAKGQEIGTREIQENIGISKEYNVFELQTALQKRDVLKANQIINYFDANPKLNPLVLVLGNLCSWFSKILKYHYISDKSQLAKELGVHPFFVKDYEAAAHTYTMSKAYQAITVLREYDLKIKGVDIAPSTTAGELMKEMIWKLIH
ncbi:MAG: DNA polymerase III subunit delta [Sphingobacteriales bacterium]|nr:MAG: DNA polymerase III subunit delta [Sphingobacteriales bacterium]TAF78327.1 MAG: DNA polymerase III subunit delta [Sphingobacteriales bacterium]